MRVGLIGDVHAEDERLAATLAALHQAKADLVLCTGDLVDGYGDVDRACALLTEHRVLTVRGERDRWIREDAMRHVPRAHRMTALSPPSIELLKSLPATRSVDLRAGRVLLCHGVGASDTQQLQPTDRRRDVARSEAFLAVLLDPRITVMISGRTHVPMIRTFSRGGGAPPLVVVNPGTLARDEEPGYFVLDAARARVETYRLGERLTVVPTSRAIL